MKLNLKSEYYLPSENRWIRVEHFHRYEEKEIIELIHFWFNENYIDPAENCSIDRGEYFYIYGGPFRADEVIEEEFGNIIEGTLLEKAYNEIPNNNDDFSCIPDRFWSDYTVDNPYLIFQEHIKDIKRLKAVPNNDIELHKKYIGLLFANVLTSFETYIADELIHIVKENKKIESSLLRKLKKKNGSAEKDIVEQIYSLTFSNPNILKKYFLDILDISVSEENQLEQLYSIRNDIMHRNGKNIKGEEVINDEMDLDGCLSQVESLVQEIINNQAEVKKDPSSCDIEIDDF